MVFPDNEGQLVRIKRRFSKRGRYMIIFCVLVLTFTYYQVGKTNIPATQQEIAQLRAAALVDDRPIVLEKLDKELSLNPHPKVWELNRIKEKLGLTYVDEIAKESATKNGVSPEAVKKDK